jgi:hypothetical protein
MLTTQTDSTPLDTRDIAVLIPGLLAASAPAIAAPWVGEAMETLVRSVDLAQPYLSGSRPALLYLAMPAVVLASFVLVLGPGLLAALALDRAPTPARWISNGFLLSLFGVSALMVLLLCFGSSPTGASFVAWVAAGQVASAAWLGVRLRRGPPPRSPFGPGNRAFWWSLAALLVLGLVGLTPKLFWEAFNGDGHEMNGVARLLLVRPVPFSPPDSGAMSGYPGVNMMLTAYPVSWFSRLFGDQPSAARIPFLLFLGVLQAATVAFAERRRGRLDGTVHALIAMGLVSYALVMCYSATYDPYGADVALPATQDTLLIALFLIAVVAQLQGESFLEAGATFGMLLCSPNGLPLAVVWLAARAFVARQPPWPALGRSLAILVACMVLSSLVPTIVGALGLPLPGQQHSATNLLRRFGHIEPLDLRRFLFLFVPCGIYPIAALLDLRRSASDSQAMLLTSFGIFAIYYPLATLSLHYFAPAMVLPLAAFWSGGHRGDWRSRPGVRLVLVGLALLAVGLNLPTGTALYDATRELGERIDVSGASGLDANEPRAHRASLALRLLFPGSAFIGVPDERLGLSAPTMRYYAERAPSGEKHYALVDPGGSAPEGFTEIGRHPDATVYIASRERWERDQRMRPARSLGRGIYIFSRDHLFTSRVWRVARETRTISVTWWLEHRPALVLAALGALAIAGASAALAFRVWLLRGRPPDGDPRDASRTRPPRSRDR